MLSRAPLILFSCCVLALRARADVLVVSASGGGQFTSIQAGVDAAIPGDVVLVRPGTYAGFSILAKDVSVVGDIGGNVLVQGKVVVDEIGADDDVLLHRLSVDGGPTPGTYRDGLRISACSGSIRLQESLFQGGLGRPGMWAEASQDVAAVGCTLIGGPGLSHASSYQHGGSVRGSRAAFYGCELRGGDGAGSSCTGYPGGSGLASRNSIVFAAGSLFVGANGHDSGPGGGTGWSDGGHGGHGVNLSPNHSGSGSVFLHFLDEFIPGLAGSGSTTNCACGLTTVCYGEDGLPGVEIFSYQINTFVPISGHLPQLGAGHNPVREQETVDLTFLGQPGDQVLAFFGTKTGYVASEFKGVQLVGDAAPNGARVVGTIGASGSLVFPLTAPELGPGVESLVVHVQSMHKNSGGHFVLGNAVHLVLLDQAL